jgi:hypothetical protein
MLVVERRTALALAATAISVLSPALYDAAFAQAAPPPATQQQSPMVETTRAHERLTERAVGGELRSLNGPGGRPMSLWIPEAVSRRSNNHILIHFHGAAWLPVQAAAPLKDPPVVVVVNLGAGSSAYDRAFANPTAFDSLLQAVREQLPSSARTSRVSLTAFSAGHGAIRAILRVATNVEQVHDVLLLDGLHTSYEPAGRVLHEGGALDTLNLIALERFAHAASRGEKRMIITHSEIFPGSYASTTETADWLLQRLSLRRTPTLTWGPRGMQQLSEVRARGLTLLGFAGNSAPDHIDHFHAMPELLARLVHQ